MNQTYLKEDPAQLLCSACQVQFGFNPSQVMSGMRFVEQMTASQYVFQDTGTHSRIILDVETSQASLVTEYEGHPYWDEAELSYYRLTDGDLAVQRNMELARLQAAQTAPFFINNAQYLRSLVTVGADMREGIVLPLEQAQLLLRAAMDAGDADVQSFAGAIGTRDAESLAVWLVKPIEMEYRRNSGSQTADSRGKARVFQGLERAA